MASDGIDASCLHGPNSYRGVCAAEIVVESAQYIDKSTTPTHMHEIIHIFK